MKHAGTLLTMLVMLVIAAAAPAQADVPTKMNVQGRLTSGTGGPVPLGFKQFTFKIFDQQSGGVEIWPAGPGETQTLTTDVNGLWGGSIGSLIPLTEAVFQNPVRWLEFTVNDGINPPETLPRVELKTSAYTYRAATSQKADSLGGSTISDLENRFVDGAGDVMTGALSNDWSQQDQGANISVNNTKDGWLDKWGDAVGTWGVTADVGGDNGGFNVGLAGSAQGSDNVDDANYGVMGYADGSGSINVGVHSSTGLQGTDNYSGYFFNGDFLVDAPQTAGTGGVLLPPNAIDAGEILNESGLVSNTNAGTVILNSTAMSDVVTVTITIPTDGYIKLDAMANIIYGGTTELNQGWYQIDEVAGGGFETGYYSGGGEAGYASATASQYSLYVQRIYFRSAGTYTFRLEGQAWGCNSVGAFTHCRNAVLTGVFYPASYGSVTTVAAADEAGQFESATTTRVSSPSGERPGVDGEVYLVDLRELELKAAKAQAASERARRELLEARMSSMVRSSRATVENGEVQDQ